jgi:alpha-galactosidase
MRPAKQVPDPTKFPNGFKAVADFIHNLGMMSGLYTAKGPHTCQRRAASCLHEAQDAKNWALWGIDYVKDDSCSTCLMPNGATEANPTLTPWTHT